MKPKARTTKISAATRQQPTAKATASPRALGGLAVSTLAALVLVVALVAVFANGNRATQSAQPIVSVPTAVSKLLSVPPPVSTKAPEILPSPTRQVLATPTVHIWPSPYPIQGIIDSVMDSTAEVGVAQKSSIDRPVPISQLIWAPTGDKLLYLTQLGDLFWSNTDGSSATLLQHYAEVYDQLEEQMPMTNTLLIRHLGAQQPDGTRAASYMDVITFTPSQPPTLQHGPNLPHAPHHLRWWSPTRASGIAHPGEDGGDLLVTVDQNGTLVSEVNVPYMLSGAVRPGGGWLAYATSYQVQNPIDGSSPQTVYLLNLTTGQRLQVTAGGSVGAWSPDGNWFVMSSHAGLRVVSPDGKQWLTVPDPVASSDAVWSPDSKYLAYATVQDLSSDGHTISGWQGAVHIVNIPARQVSNLSAGAMRKAAPQGAALMWQPKWSRTSSLLSFLSFNPECSFECSQLTPAIFIMSPTQ